MDSLADLRGDADNLLCCGSQKQPTSAGFGAAGGGEGKERDYSLHVSCILVNILRVEATSIVCFHFFEEENKVKKGLTKHIICRIVCSKHIIRRIILYEDIVKHSAVRGMRNIKTANSRKAH